MLSHDRIHKMLLSHLLDIKKKIKGTVLQTFSGRMNTKQLNLEASFSPDSQFVISGKWSFFYYIQFVIRGKGSSFL